MTTGQSETYEISPALEEALAQSGETTVRISSAPQGSSLVISTNERVGVLSLVAGVLSLHRLQIRGARIYTRGERAAQEWIIKPLFGDLPDERAIASDVRAALAGDLDVASRLEKRSKSMKGASATDESQAVGVPGAEPLVFIDDSPQHHTVVEVRAHDEPALLYRLTRALLAADVVVVGAKVDTLGSEVVDSFFVTDRNGHPLGADHADAVRTTVRASVQATVQEPSVAR
jgi:[protein-PII] uridylyltransferase